MQIPSRSVLRTTCVSLLLLVSACAAPQPRPIEREAPRFAVGSPELPVVAAPEHAALATEPEPVAPAPIAFETPVPPSTRSSSQDQSWRINRPPDHNFSFMLGVRNLNDSSWDGVDSIPDISFTEDSKVFGANFSIDFGVHYSASGSKFVDETQNEASSEVWEFNVGLLKRFAPGQGIWQPYVGAGIALVRAAGTIPAVVELPRDDAWSFGLYARAGIALAVSEGGSVGLDFRYLGLTDVELSGVSTDVNGPTAALFFGVGW